MHVKLHVKLHVKINAKMYVGISTRQHDFRVNARICIEKRQSMSLSIRPKIQQNKCPNNVKVYV